MSRHPFFMYCVYLKLVSIAGKPSFFIHWQAIRVIMFMSVVRGH